MENEKNLSAQEICSIIKACSEFGVSRFIYGDLRVFFGKQTKEFPDNQMPITHPMPASGELNPNLEEKALVQAEVLTKEDQLELMKIEDPAEFEELMSSGELEDGQLSGEEE